MNYQEAKSEILAGKAVAHPLWVLLSHEKEREEFALKPAMWEGSGEYQRVVHADTRDVLVKVPFGEVLPAGAA